jgi:hypothetical protein
VKPPAELYPYLLPVNAGIALVLVGLVAIARVVGWTPDSRGDSGGVLAHDRAGFRVASLERVGPRCPECSMIVSVRKIEGFQGAAGPVLARYRDAGERDTAEREPATSYEIVVRMADGSSRAIRQARPASWQPGESVIVIDSVGTPDR